MISKRIGLLFDIDDTLLLSSGIDDACFLEAFSEVFGIPAQDVELAWHSGGSSTDSGAFREMCITHIQRPASAHEREKFETLFLAQLEARIPETQVAKGLKGFLEMLSNNKLFSIGIVTGSLRASGLIKLAHLGLPSEMLLSTATEFEERPRILGHGVQQLKTAENVDELWFFGDGEWDWLAARELDIHFIGVDLRGNGKLLAKGARHVIGDFTELQKLPFLNQA